MKFSDNKLYGKPVVGIELVEKSKSILDFLLKNDNIVQWEYACVDIDVINEDGEIKTYFMWEFPQWCVHNPSAEVGGWKDLFLQDNSSDKDLFVY